MRQDEKPARSCIGYQDYQSHNREDSVIKAGPRSNDFFARFSPIKDQTTDTLTQ
jgi:hypothetical protein